MVEESKLNSYVWMEDPSRNFNILGIESIMDPLDGREKVVLSNFAAGNVGNLIFIDAETGEGEAIVLPGDNGAWAVLNLNNEKLLVGTCAGYGYLHCLDLRTRTWAESLRVESETYIWNLALGSDGLVYGGTYPGCVLLQYDPIAHNLKNLGRASDNPKDLYSRFVDGGLPGYVLISGGMDTSFVSAYHIDSGEFRHVDSFDQLITVRNSNAEFICVETKDNLLYYDPITFKRVKESSKENRYTVAGTKILQDGRVAGVRGQDYFIKNPEDENPVLLRIPTPAPTTHIHTLTADAKGNIWGSSGFGQTIFSFNPENKDLWNSSVVCNIGGEVYGMVFTGDRLFMSTYSGGDHVVYDPSKPWSQLDNLNPQTLKSVAPALIRPTGRSVLGPDGGVWSGWSAKYGVYGGGLTRIDVSTLEVELWYDPIPEQQIAGLTQDEQYLYFTTDGGSSGLVYKEEPFHFAVWSTKGELVYKKQFDQGIRLSTVLAHSGLVYVRVDDDIHVFNPQTMEFNAVISIGLPCSCMLAVDDNTIGAFCGDQLYYIDVNLGSFREVTTLPGKIGAAVKTPDGRIYFAHGVSLFRVET